MKKGWPEPTLCAIGRTVSRFLFYPVIYLRNLPPGKERAALSIPAEAFIMPVYMVLLVLVPSPPYVAIRRRELLPRGFTLTLAGGLFSVTAFIRLLPSVLSTAGCPSCPDFPLSRRLRGNYLPPVADGDSPEGHTVFTLFRPATYCPYVFFQKIRTRSRRLVPSR